MDDQNFGGQGGGFQPKPKFKGNWKCSNKDCGAEITELPFQPDPNRTDRPIVCLECWKKNRQQRPGFNR